MKDINYLKSNGVDIDKSLELFGNIETYNDTIGEFLHGIIDKLNKLNNYKATGDMAQYAIYAHSLKSDAKYFGFFTLADIAYEHELKSKANDYYYITNNFQKLTEEVEKTKTIVEQYMSDEPLQVIEDTANPVTPAVTAYEKQTILVVDDSNIVRNFVKRIFSEKYDVGVAEDGQEALDILEANKDNDNIICILLDLNMPKVSGFKVLDYMKENNLFTKYPTSIISGDSSKETIDRAFTYGIVDMLGKPFNADDVKRVVEKNIYYKEMNN